MRMPTLGMTMGLTDGTGDPEHCHTLKYLLPLPLLQWSRPHSPRTIPHTLGDMKHLAPVLITFTLLALSWSAFGADCPNNGQIDRMVCANDGLQAEDAKVALLIQRLLNDYNDPQQRNLVAGQMTWLALRDEACLSNGQPSKQFAECIFNVYREREAELNDELVVQQSYLRQTHAAPDIEAILDRRDILDHGSRGMYYAMYFDMNFQIYRHPETCRQLYTLNAGAWQYSLDTMGENAYGADYQKCQFAVLSAQDHSSKRRAGSAVDFDNLETFSNEFMCLIYVCDGDHYDQLKRVETFHHRHQGGEIRIINGEFPVWTYPGCEKVLVKNTDSFCFDDFNVRYQMSSEGDYTNKGRREVLMDIAYWPTQGSMRGHVLVVAWYDPRLNAIRPEQIAASSRLRLILQSDLVRPLKSAPAGHKRASAITDSAQ